MLRQIGRLNGILPEDIRPAMRLKQQSTRRRTRSLSPKKRRSKAILASTTIEKAGLVPVRTHEPVTSSTRQLVRRKTSTRSPHQPEYRRPPAPPLHSPAPEQFGWEILTDPVHQQSHFSYDPLATKVPSSESSTPSTEKRGGASQHDRAACLFQTHGPQPNREQSLESGPVRPHTRPRSMAEIHTPSAFSIGNPGKLSPLDRASSGGRLGSGGEPMFGQRVMSASACK